MRKNYSSGAKWEDIVGYSRAVRVGNRIEVAGTTAVKDGEIQCKDDLYGQTKCILQIIESALISAGSSMDDVVRTRMFVTDASKWEEAGRAHGEFFAHIKPATTLVEVSAFVDSDMLIEIEAVAIIAE